MRCRLIIGLIGLLAFGGVQAQDVQAQVVQAQVVQAQVKTGDTGGPIKIGIAAPLTGPSAAFGAQIRNGASQAITDINTAGGINGRMLEAAIGDDASEPKQGVSLANKLVGEGVKAVVGHFNSGVSIPASDAYLDADIIQVTPASTSVKFTERGFWNTFRTCSRDDQQGAVAGTYLAAHFKDRKIAVVHDRTPYGKGLAEETLKVLRAKGGKEVLFEGINPGEKGYPALVSKMKSLGVELVYFGGVHTEAGLIVRQMREQGLAAPMMSGDAIPDQEFVQLAGPGAEGTLMTFAPDARRNPNATAVVAAFRARNIEPEAYTLYAYAAVQVLAKALAETGSSEGKALAAWLHQGKPIDTVIGPIAYDWKGDVIQADFVLYEWKKRPDGRIDYAGQELAR